MKLVENNCISYKKISEGNDSIFSLFNHFGENGVIAESNIIFFAEDVIKGYNGGIWNFFETSNGSFFMSLDCDGFKTIKMENGDKYTMPVELACAAICAFVYRMLSRNYNKQDKHVQYEIYNSHFLKMKDFLFSSSNNQYARQLHEFLA